jgi:adenylosuccinate synthase
MEWKDKVAAFTPQKGDGGTERPRGFVDVVVGMQFGDEGKGATAALLQKLGGYAFSVRAGGSQAEHRFRYGPAKYRYRVLPCASFLRNSISLLASGHIIRPDILQDEIIENNIDPASILIDDNAAWIGRGHREKSRAQKSHGRGGYSMGISQALQEKTSRKDDAAIARGNTETTCVSAAIQRFLLAGKAGLVEGSQGALLSLNHGQHPFTTSYDVITDALLGQCGIPHEAVRDIYGVLKCYPTRVSGTSGPMDGGAVEYEWVETRAGVEIPEYRRWQTEEDNTRRGQERLSHFSHEEFAYACWLNAPTHLILTHTDWVTPERRDEIAAIASDIARAVLGRECPVIMTRHGDDLDQYTLTHAGQSWGWSRWRAE